MMGIVTPLTAPLGVTAMGVLTVKEGTKETGTASNYAVRMEDMSHFHIEHEGSVDIVAGEHCRIRPLNGGITNVVGGNFLSFRGNDSSCHKVYAKDNASVSDIRDSTVKVGDNSFVLNISGFSEVIAGRNARVTITSQRTTVMVGEGSSVNVRIGDGPNRRYDVSNTMTVDVILPNTFYDVLSDGSLELA